LPPSSASLLFQTSNPTLSLTNFSQDFISPSFFLSKTDTTYNLPSSGSKYCTFIPTTGFPPPPQPLFSDLLTNSNTTPTFPYTVVKRPPPPNTIYYDSKLLSENKPVNEEL
jgi:hypothetical protein